MQEYAHEVVEAVKARDPLEPEFYQAVTEVFEAVTPVLDTHSEYRQTRILERLVEPERVLMFRVPWVDDSCVYDLEGISGEKLAYMADLWTVYRKSAKKYADKYDCEWRPDTRPWRFVKCDIAVPTAMQNRIEAANAGGVATSGLEMSQNSMRLNWSRVEVNERLHQIMRGIHRACLEAAERLGSPDDYAAGANIAGFLKVAEAMMDQGVV